MSKTRIIAHIILVLLLVSLAACKPGAGPTRTPGGTGGDQNAGNPPGQSASNQAAGGGQGDAIAQEVKLGNDVFIKYGCLGCHKVGDEGGTTGPDLTLVGQRKTMEQMSAWIRNPQAVKPDAAMPAQSAISDQDMQYLVRYLSTLK